MAICFYTNYGSEKCKLCVFNSVKDVTLSYHLAANVRRYVQLAQSRGGACFCTRGAMQDYDDVLFILALAKTVTPGGSPRREPGQAAPPTTKRSSLARIPIAIGISRCGEAMTYTDLLAKVVIN